MLPTGRGASEGRRGLLRAAMLVAWCLALWGTLLLLASAWRALTAGPAAAWSGFARLSPVNQLLALAAAGLWIVAGLGLWAARSENPGTP